MTAGRRWGKTGKPWKGKRESHSVWILKQERRPQVTTKYPDDHRVWRRGRIGLSLFLIGTIPNNFLWFDILYPLIGTIPNYIWFDIRVCLEIWNYLKSGFNLELIADFGLDFYHDFPNFPWFPRSHLGPKTGLHDFDGSKKKKNPLF